MQIQFVDSDLNLGSPNIGEMTALADTTFIYGWLHFVITMGGALQGLGGTVIFRPIKSGVQVYGIIHPPKGLATSSAITACLQP